METVDRTKFIGGSEAAGVLGLSRWQTPLSIWAAKTEQFIPPDGDELYKKLGVRLEEVVAELFTEKTGKRVQRANERRVHPKYPFIVAQIDRLVVGEDETLECKTASAWKAKEWAGEEIPQEYIIQVMHGLAVTGRKRAHLAVLIGNQDFIVKTVERDEQAIKEMIAKEVYFWNTFVIPKVMPSIVSSQDASTLYGLFPLANPESFVELTDEANQIIEMRNALYQDKIMLEGQIETADNRLKAMLKECEMGCTPQWVVTWKNQERKEHMVKASKFRRLTIREAKQNGKS